MGMGVFEAFDALNGREVTAAELHSRTKGDLLLLGKQSRDVGNVNFWGLLSS